MLWMWLLVLIVVIAAVVVKLKRSARFFIVRQNHVNRNQTFNQPIPPEHQVGEVERMVCCEYCSIYVPVSEALERSGKIFCCQEHSVTYFSDKHSS